MALTAFDKDVNIISALDTEPNDVGGLDAEELKAKFDEAANLLKNYMNKTLLPELEAAIEAAALGVPSVGGIDGRIIVDGSIDTNKYAAGSVNELAVANGAITGSKVADRAITGDKVARASISRENLTEDAIMLQSTDFPNKVVPGRALADETIEGTKIAPKAVTAQKLADDAKTLVFTVTLSPIAWSNNAQTVSNTNFYAAGYKYDISPDPSSFIAYSEALIYCENITVDGEATFVCANIPSESLTVNIGREIAS